MFDPELYQFSLAIPDPADDTTDDDDEDTSNVI